MNMTPRNIILFALAIGVGLVAGFAYPIIGLLLLIPVLGYIAFILFNNKGAGVADEGAAQAARQFIAADGKAAIYIMRDGFVGGQQGMNVVIDDSLTSQFRTGRFVVAEVEPGEHVITGRMAAQTKGSAVNHSVTLGAGECILLDAKLNVGALQGKLEFLETRDPAQARSKLAKLKLVEWQ